MALRGTGRFSCFERPPIAAVESSSPKKQHESYESRKCIITIRHAYRYTLKNMSNDEFLRQM